MLCGGSTTRSSTLQKELKERSGSSNDLLTQQTKSLYGEEIPNQILATGKDVIVIGGGDTGSDCELPTDRSKISYQFEIMSTCWTKRTTPLALLAFAIKNILSHIRKVVTGIG
jgi:glutamate synthase (NADPH/NADH) small chain